MEIPAPVAGVVDKLLVKLGDKVSEGTPIATIAAGNGAPAGEPQLDAAPAADTQEPEAVAPIADAPAGQQPASPPVPAEAAAGSPAPASGSPAPASGPPAPASGPPAPAAGPPAPASGPPASASGPPAPAMGDGEPPYASPLARRIARELGVDLGRVSGT